VPRKLILIASAIVALGTPATAQAANFSAQRVSEAKVARSTQPVAARAAQQPQVPAVCANADLAPNAGNLDKIRVAVVCLHNQVRVRNGLPLLKGNTRLRRAAEAHSADMVAKRYFAHDSQSGASMVDRILGAGYVREDQGWLLGENLEWGTGSLATPRGAIQAWMDSPGHRANLLKRGYRHMGVGISLGVPTGDGAGATYTVDFGARR
jgi:uncharacterized protein YkwD